MSIKQKKENTPVIPEPSVDNGVPSHTHEYGVRLEKVAQLRALGIEPWPAARSVNATCEDILKNSNALLHDAPTEPQMYDVSGRIVAFREHGKTIFFHIQDASGKLQLYIKYDIVGEQLFDFITRFLDIGDIIWVRGPVFVTKTGETTLKVQQLVLLSKALRPLPEKFHGLVDVETKYRQRYLDLLTNHESRERFVKRSRIIQTMRNFLDNQGFIEVETPMLHPIPGGALAKPFVTHHNALDTELYLRIAPELYLKRLVVGGIERVYEINRCFRNEGISTRHNPEFTTVELYAAHLDYRYMMNFVQQMIQAIVREVAGTGVVTFGSHTIDFDKPFACMSMIDAISRYGQTDKTSLSPEHIDAFIADRKLTLPFAHPSWGEKINFLFEELVESKLIQPTYITQFPIEVSPLAKKNQENPLVVDRFELFVAGMELSNGFNELNDPLDQAERFKEQAKSRAGGNVEAHYYDADFITALEHGLPPTVGVGIGIDRLTMFLTNASSIKDVILFPTLKKQHESID